MLAYIKYFQLLLIFVVLPLIIGLSEWHDARDVRERASRIEAEPAEASASDLIAIGPPENRHVRVTAYSVGENYAAQRSSEGDSWRYALVPVFPAGVDDCGENVRLVARVKAYAEEQLHDLLDGWRGDGCVWTDDPVDWYDDRLRDAYPDLQPDGYRVIRVGYELPTVSRAERHAFWATVALSVAALATLLIAYAARRNHRLRQVQGWYAEASDPACQLVDDPFDRPGRLVPLLRSAAFYASAVGFPTALATGALMKIGLIPEPLALIGVSWGMILAGGGAMTFVALTRVFAEQYYELADPARFSRSARSYFDRATDSVSPHGYTVLGDLWVTDGIRAAVRLLLSDDQTRLVSLEAGLGQRAYNFYSITQEGLLLHSESINLQRDFSTPLPSRCEWTGKQDIVEGHRSHGRLVDWATLNTRMEGDLLPIDPSYATGLLDYAHRISGWSLREAGVTRLGVPQLPRAEHLVQVVDGHSVFAWRARPTAAALKAPQAPHESFPAYGEAGLTESTTEVVGMR